MKLRTALLSAGLCLATLGAASLPAQAEDGRNAAAAIGIAAGIAAGAGGYQGGYNRPRRAYYGGYGRRDDGDGWRRAGGDGDGDGWRRRRMWCSYHPDRC